MSSQSIGMAGIVIPIIFAVIFLIPYIWFLAHLYRLVKSIPKEKQIFAPWFVWLILIPIIGYVFEWLMLPFGIGKALQKYHNKAIQKKGRTIFSLGLAKVILSFFGFIFHIFLIPVFVIWIIYWVQANKVYYLLKK